MPRVVRGLASTAYAILLWPAALWLAWLLLAKADFLYSVGYRLLDIPTTLSIYVPQNRHGRQDFIRTDATEHARLFAAIAEAVRHGGKGLEELRYHDPQGRELGWLLTRDEIIHLRDVAYLIERWERAGLLAFAGWAVLALVLSLKKEPIPRTGRLLASNVAGLAVLAGALLAFGPVEVFYAWHRWVFPPDHPWFFYYQDSLMSSLMQAPDLFGFIGAVWLGASLVFLLALNHAVRLAVRILMPRRSSSITPD